MLPEHAPDWARGSRATYRLLRATGPAGENVVWEVLVRLVCRGRYMDARVGFIGVGCAAVLVAALVATGPGNTASAAAVVGVLAGIILLVFSLTSFLGCGYHAAALPRILRENHTADDYLCAPIGSTEYSAAFDRLFLFVTSAFWIPVHFSLITAILLGSAQLRGLFLEAANIVCSTELLAFAFGFLWYWSSAVTLRHRVHACAAGYVFLIFLVSRSTSSPHALGILNWVAGAFMLFVGAASRRLCCRTYTEALRDTGPG